MICQCRGNIDFDTYEVAFLLIEAEVIWITLFTTRSFHAWSVELLGLEMLVMHHNRSMLISVSSLRQVEGKAAKQV